MQSNSGRSAQNSTIDRQYQCYQGDIQQCFAKYCLCALEFDAQSKKPIRLIQNVATAYPDGCRHRHKMLLNYFQQIFV